jgi:5-hydroxyisourate hydrolase
MTNNMSGITTHVLDTSRGRPAAGVPVSLEKHDGNYWTFIGRGETDHDGRCRTLLNDPLQRGTYRLTFAIAQYFGEGNTFFPEAVIVFDVKDETQHYHVPLLVSPYGYSTYRGS